MLGRGRVGTRSVLGVSLVLKSSIVIGPSDILHDDHLYQLCFESKFKTRT